MKKIYFLFLLMLLPLVASAHDAEIGGIYYYLDSSAKTATVTYRGNNYYDYVEYSGEIIIPESVTYNDVTYSVTSIGSSAFSGCSGLTSVTILNTVTTIGQYAFNGCSGLTSVNVYCIPTSIGYAPFYNCSNIKEVTFDCETVTSLFSGLSSIEKVTMTEKVTSIGEGAFKSCSGLTSVTIPNSVTSIGSSAFSSCSGLTSVTIPNSVTSIGEEAFCNCKNLVSVVIGSGVTSIGSYAFSSTNLKKTIWLTNTPPTGASYAQGAINYVSNDQYNISNKVVYPFLSSYFDVDGVRYVPVSLSDKTCDAIDWVYGEIADNIKVGPTVNYKGISMKINKVGDYTFFGCRDFEKIVINSEITNIGNSAFASCSSIKTLVIDDSETDLNLGSNMFSSSLLDSVYIGRNINYSTKKDDGYSPFYSNTTLRAVKITDRETEISENEFYGCSNLQRVIIGDGVTSIGNWAFSGCQSLKFFTFGSEVKTIGQEAFSDCTAVTEITSRAINPPTCGSQALDDINKWECKLYVPKGYLAPYQNAEQWKEFLFAEEGDYTIATKYTLTYMVDGEAYKTYQVAEGSAITPEPAPTKDGYVFSGWSTIPTTMPAKDVVVTGTFTLKSDADVIKISSARQSTWCSAYDLDFTNIEDLKAYIASGYDRETGTIWLTRVKKVPAKEGILLIGKAGEYQVPHKSTTTYYVNMMVGTLNAITINEKDGEYTNYYLSNGSYGVGFYKVNGTQFIAANRAYLPLLKDNVPAGTRYIGLGFDEGEGTTGIRETKQSREDGAYYTLQGQRVMNPGKGLYIKNGKKVVIK